MARLSDYVSVSQAAKEKGVPADTVRRRIARGRLRAEKIGEQWVIRRKELDGWHVQRKGLNGKA